MINFVKFSFMKILNIFENKFSKYFSHDFKLKSIFLNSFSNHPHAFRTDLSEALDRFAARYLGYIVPSRLRSPKEGPGGSLSSDSWCSVVETVLSNRCRKGTQFLVDKLSRKGAQYLIDLVWRRKMKENQNFSKEKKIEKFFFFENFEIWNLKNHQEKQLPNVQQQLPNAQQTTMFVLYMFCVSRCVQTSSKHRQQTFGSRFHNFIIVMPSVSVICRKQSCDPVAESHKDLIGSRPVHKFTTVKKNHRNGKSNVP